MHKKRSILALVLVVILSFSCLSACGKEEEKTLLDPDNPTTVTVWNYYNGDQLTAFETLVNTFNNTVGADEGIIVVSVSQGSIDNLATALLESVEGKVGAADVPSLAAIYSETVYILNEEEAVVPLDSYFTQDELDEYVPSFLEEGRLKDNGELLLFPVSKSTETFIINTTDWDKFAAATGITEDSIKSYEDLAAAAKSYYEWTDGFTPDVPNDGKALYGRDSLANYINIGTTQLGHEMFKVSEDGTVTVDLDRDTFKTLWDNYYIPFINGYYAAYASHRSEDLKTGAVISMTCSSSGVSYIPTAVTDENDASYDIECTFNQALDFKNAVKPVAVQQGAGYCVPKTSEAEQYAAVEFLKWFTDTEQNLDFSITSGYSPVKKEANDVEKITAAFTVDSPKAQNVLDALVMSAQTFSTKETYTSRAFSGSKEIRDILGDALENIAVADRAAVVEQLSAGASLEDAVAPYATDEYFDAWFEKLCKDVNAAIK